MGCMLGVDRDLVVYGREAAEWEKYGVSIQRVDTMQEAIKLIKQGDNYFFIGINEDSVPEFMAMLPILRDITDTPIFILSNSYTIDKKVKAMSLGADIYERYNEDTRKNALLALELMKTQSRWANRADSQLEVLACRDVILSKPRRKVFVKGEEVLLGRKEFDILRTLMTNFGCVVEHKKLLHEIWGENYSEKDADVLWRTINRLRVKLSGEKSSDEYIKIERGVGYIFEA